MKKTILPLFIGFLLFAYPLHSQIKLGLQLGTNFAKINIKPINIENESRTNLFGGILAEIKINNMFYIQPEFNYIQKGITYRYPATSIPDKVDNLFNYYEIPINILVKFDMGSFTPFIFSGPSLNLLSEAKVKYTVYAQHEVDVSDRFTTDLAINFGGGAEFSFSNSIYLFITARYSLGLTNIFDYEPPTHETFEYYTRCITLAAGLKFSI